MDDRQAPRSEAVVLVDLRTVLDPLVAQTLADPGARLAVDPVAFVHRYAKAEDAEIAGLVASQFAYGRVSLFRPVLQRIFDHVDSYGGPRAFVAGLDASRTEGLVDLQYRWTRGPDLIAFLQSLHDALGRYDTVAGTFSGPDATTALKTGIARLTDGMDLKAASHGLRYFYAQPGKGAAKRWNMYLRWMVRPDDGIDRGLWSHVPVHTLVMPVDTHILRISRFLGLTSRKDGSWKTAVAITEALRELNPDDPVRYDFALAHLGISGGCTGWRQSEICGSCPLDGVCTAPSKRSTR